jgi:hypothetical protein
VVSVMLKSVPRLLRNRQLVKNDCALLSHSVSQEHSTASVHFCVLNSYFSHTQSVTFCSTEFHYSETNMTHFIFSLLRIKGLYMFRALLTHPQEVLHSGSWNTLCMLCQLAAPGLNCNWCLVGYPT